jgi:hypothetical protein
MLQGLKEVDERHFSVLAVHSMRVGIGKINGSFNLYLHAI